MNTNAESLSASVNLVRKLGDIYIDELGLIEETMGKDTNLTIGYKYYKMDGLEGEMPELDLAIKVLEQTILLQHNNRTED